VGSLPLRAALVLLALAGAILRAHADPPHAPFPLAAVDVPSPAQLAELEHDHVLLEGNMSSDPDGRGATSALVLFERPRAEVLRLLASTSRQKEYRPELSRLDVIEASENGDVAEYRVRFMLTTLRYRARHGWDYAKGRVWWTLDPAFDNDMQVLDGLWELRELDAHRTLGRFTTRIDLGPALPAFLQDYATRKKLPESMEQVRHWVDSGGRWRP
jgi:hypothetical protein